MLFGKITESLWKANLYCSIFILAKHWFKHEHLNYRLHPVKSFFTHLCQTHTEEKCMQNPLGHWYFWWYVSCSCTQQCQIPLWNNFSVLLILAEPQGLHLLGRLLCDFSSSRKSMQHICCNRFHLKNKYINKCIVKCCGNVDSLRIMFKHSAARKSFIACRTTLKV